MGPLKAVAFGIYYSGTILFLAHSARVAYRHWGPSSAFWKDPKFVWLVIGLALPRLFAIFSMPINGNEWGGDATFYSYMMNQVAPYHFFLPTGYPFLAGIIEKFFLYQLPVYSYILLVIQHALGIITALLLYERLRLDYPKFALGLSLAWGISSPAILMEHTTRPESLESFLVVLCFYLILRYKDTPKSSLLWYLGFTAGWASLTRSNFVILLPILFCFILYITDLPRLTRLNHVIRFCAGFALIYFGFILLVHYPGTGSMRHNWAMAVNLRTKISEESLSSGQNEPYLDLVTLNYQMGKFITERHIPPEAFGSYIGSSLGALHPPETRALREQFEKFRADLPIDKEAFKYTKRSEFPKFYPPAYATMISTGTSPTVGDAFLGVDQFCKLELRVYKRAIMLRPGDYLRGLARDFLSFFGFQEWSDNSEPFLPPPRRGDVRDSVRGPFGLHWGYRPGLDQNTSGCYWDPGNALLREWGRICSWILPYLYLFSLVFAAAVFFWSPLSARLAFLFYASYLLVVVAIAKGQIRYLVPVHPMAMFLLALPCSHLLRSLRSHS